VPLNGFPRQEQPARDLGVALASRDQARDLPFPLAQSFQCALSVGGRTASPCSDPEAAQSEFGHLLLGGRAHRRRQFACLSKLLRGAPAIGCLDGRGKVEPSPERRRDQAELAPLRQDRL